ncbi:molecular chaperone DnaK [Patescibacteria group bacterium]
MAKILGIDLGTTNSAMAAVITGEPQIIENNEGNRTTPSMAAISKSGDRLVGLLAKRQAVTNPTGTIFSSKRLIGRKFSDLEVQRDKNLLPYAIRASENGGVEIQMGDKWHRPEEISAMLLQKLKHDAEARIGEKIEEAIITVPAYFDDSQRKATKDAGEIAGFKVKRIINEPTAAALAYGLNKKKDEKIIVYDFGGGTFDISVLEIGDDIVEVKSTGGDTHLGGDDFDQKIIEWIIVAFKKESGIDISKDTLALQRLKEAAEKAKHELSSTPETEINIPFITSDASGPIHLLIKLTRSTLESIVREFIDRSCDITKKVIEEAGFKTSDIDEIILVGGQTRMPAVQEAIKGIFNKEANRSINPDEVVAIGAAVQAGIMQGDVKDVLLLDVTPLSLGLETLGGVFTRLIEKNTTIPTSRSQIFSTAADNQTSVEVHVLQGEREMATDNKTLGRFILDGIPPSARGVPQIEVSFDIDVNGILSVKAKDKATSKEQSIRIEASSGLSKEDVEKMKQSASTHAEDDKKKKELVEIKNSADALIYTAEKSLREAGDKIEETIKKEVTSAVEELKKVKESNDTELIKNKSQTLSQVLAKIGDALYKKTEAEKTGDAGKAGDAGNSQAKDAEYKEVKEDKKDEGNESKN